jgi:nucleoside 2-deoxyribosyltransferase
LKRGTYIASRASLPERSEAWRKLRDVDGYLIVSSWIDVVMQPLNADDTKPLHAIWENITQEVTTAERVIVYAEPDDFPLKGTLVEVGMALAVGTPIYLVLPGVEIEADTFRPIGSWINHPLVKVVNSMSEALSGADTVQ